MSKPPLHKTLAWRLEALAYDMVCLLLKPFSFDGISAFGGAVLRKIGPRTSKHHIMMTGLRIAFPDKTDDELGAISLQAWDNIGRTFAEFPVMNRVKVFGDNSRVTVIGHDKLQHLIDNKIGAVFIGGHFANWEIMAAALTQFGLPIRITYRKLNNPFIDKRVRAQRESYGTRFLVQKSGLAGARVLYDALAASESVAIMNDQKFNEGISLPFFGQQAMTAIGATRLAHKTGAPLVPMSVTRDGANFTVTVYDPITLGTSAGRDKEVENGVKAILKFTEDRILETPPQWFWVHRRWPKALYKKNTP